MDDLNAATLEDVAAFFATHYVPNNAVLSIVGDVRPRGRLRQGRDLLRRIPAGPQPAAPADDRCRR